MRQTFFGLILLGSLVLAVGCSSSSGSPPSGVPGGGGSSTSNVLSITVDGGPTAGQAGGMIYVNGAFATASICAPSSSNCVTVDHLLVDTGSFGLRVLQSEVSSLNLPTVNASNGSAAYDCVAFGDGSFLWGPVQQATITMAGETASSVPIQVISSSTANIPTNCSNGGVNENTQASLGANGILGVGLEPLDCGTSCDPSGGVSPIPPVYFTCSSLPCSAAYVSESNQVTNPVVLFPVDNNGVIVELPGVSGSTATVTGSLVFGVGTESDNQLSTTAAANLFTTSSAFCPGSDFFITTYEGQSFGINPSTCAGPGSFIDSGSNALYFPNVNSITLCSGDASAFYCPSSLLSLSAVNEDPNTMYENTVDFSVDNAQNLFTNSSTAGNAAFSTLAGPIAAGVGFDWGLPFYYGINVYSTIDGQGVPSGLPASPWWAY